MFFHAPESERRNAFPRRSTPRTGAKKAPPGRHAAAVPAECGFPRREQRCRHDGRPGVHAERDAEEGLFRPRADRRRAAPEDGAPLSLRCGENFFRQSDLQKDSCPVPTGGHASFRTPFRISRSRMQQRLKHGAARILFPRIMVNGFRRKKPPFPLPSLTKRLRLCRAPHHAPCRKLKKSG